VNIIEKIRKENKEQAQKINVNVGDTVNVYVKIKEGDKERMQVFKGTVISIRRGGAGGSFTVRRISHGVGVERIFPFASKYISKVEVENSSRVRRAKLYYLRKKTGKQSKLEMAEENRSAK